MAQQPEGNVRLPPIEIEMGLAYEFLKSLYVYHEHDKNEGKYAYEISQSWFETIRLSCPPPMLEALKNLTLRFFSAHSELFLSSWLHLLGIVTEIPPPKDVPAFLSHLELLDPFEIRLSWLGYYQRALRKVTPLDVVLQAAEGNQEALEQLCKTALSEDPVAQEQVRHFMLGDGMALKEHLLRFLRDWYECVFRQQEPQIRPILERDVEAKHQLQACVRPERLIEVATNGLLYGPEAGIRRIVLAPSYLGRPWNETLSHQDVKLFLYPASDEAVTLDHSVPPTQLVRLYQALADERRLRILKLLTTRSYSLQELSDEFGVAKTTMHHHLALLRTAGLVNMLSNENQYYLRPETIEQASRLLDTFLHRA